jgi:hypothetical protein
MRASQSGKSWNNKTMLTKLCDNWHLSMDPLDRLMNDVYDYVTGEARGAGGRWGTRNRVSLVY